MVSQNVARRFRKGLGKGPCLLPYIYIYICVNDTTKSFANFDDAFKFFDIVKSSILSGTLELRKWASNDGEL